MVQGFISWFTWSRDAAVRYWTNVFIMISLINGWCSMLLNKGFLSWFPWSRDTAVRYRNKGFYHDFLGRGDQYLTAASLDQGNHDRNLWFSTLQQHPSTKEIMMETFGSVTYLISLVKRCCSKVLNQGFLSWFPWSRDTAVRYWTKSFYDDFLDRGMLQ
jgi:hypothetical protein